MNMIITPAYAAGGTSLLGSFEPFILLAVFAAVFYFFLWRPQAKRTKAHKELLSQLKKGDEIVTAGGIAGTIIDVGENFTLLEIDRNAKIKVQKSSIATVLPKGTLKTI
ncbi:MAG: preprotein translocase subunit YajC [Candidatus Portiera sp.]|nr:preprotein translocase subunit YajC [Portiera sp.]